jgi:hypothetical protein
LVSRKTREEVVRVDHQARVLFLLLLGTATNPTQPNSSEKRRDEKHASGNGREEDEIETRGSGAP